MTTEQYLMVATHKLLDKLEADGTPYKRTSKKEEENFAKQIEEIKNLSKMIKKQNEEEESETAPQDVDQNNRFDWKKELMQKVRDENAK